MKRKTILWSALAGAVLGAAGAFVASHRRVHLGDAIFDRAAINRSWVLAVLGWVIFSLYWEAAGKMTAQTKSSESSASRSTHVALTNFALFLVVAPFRGMGRFVPVPAAGLAVEAAGLALAIVARRHLGRYWSGEITIKVDHQLIRSGPYRKLRHPIYTGLLTMYAGTALVTGTWPALAGCAVAGLAYARKIRLEERNLQAAFGAAYDEYRRESWALVPGLF